MQWPPPANEIPALPVNELALQMLTHFVTSRANTVHRNNDATNARFMAKHGPDYADLIVLRALGEAFDWLHFNGLIAASPGNDDGYRYVTARGKEVIASTNPRARLELNSLLPIVLHPAIDQQVKSQFLIGAYESAVFGAFRQVEIEVRNRGKYPATELGVSLMRKAFDPNGGPLQYPGLVKSELEATSSLFAGSIGVYKNPLSHRQVDFTDPRLAAKAAMFADLLLSTIDEIIVARITAGWPT